MEDLKAYYDIVDMIRDCQSVWVITVNVRPSDAHLINARYLSPTTPDEDVVGPVGQGEALSPVCVH